MKTITVRYFALFRENAGLDEETLTLDAETAADVFAATRDRHGSAEPLGHCKVAINDQMVDWDAPVGDGEDPALGFIELFGRVARLVVRQLELIVTVRGDMCSARGS